MIDSILYAAIVLNLAAAFMANRDWKRAREMLRDASKLHDEGRAMLERFTRDVRTAAQHVERAHKLEADLAAAISGLTTGGAAR